MKKFREGYIALQDLVLMTGIDGEWIDLGNHKQFRGKDGAVLNYWESTKTVNFQGVALAGKEFERALDALVEGNTPRTGAL